MDTMKFFIYLAISAGVTYLIRMIPFVLCRGKMENQFIRSFLFYVPYAVLGAMTFPAILGATGSIISAAVGFGVAFLLAYLEKSLVVVAASSCAAVFVCEKIIEALPGIMGG